MVNTLSPNIQLLFEYQLVEWQNKDHHSIGAFDKMTTKLFTMNNEAEVSNDWGLAK